MLADAGTCEAVPNYAITVTDAGLGAVTLVTRALRTNFAVSLLTRLK